MIMSINHVLMLKTNCNTCSLTVSLIAEPCSNQTEIRYGGTSFYSHYAPTSQKHTYKFTVRHTNTKHTHVCRHAQPSTTPCVHACTVTHAVTHAVTHTHMHSDTCMRTVIHTHALACASRLDETVLTIHCQCVVVNRYG